MDSRARLKARISNLKELRELVRMMRGLAATRLHEAQAALDGIRSYQDVVEEALGAAGSLLPPQVLQGPNIPIAGEHVLIVVTTEHGFAGAFNDRLVESARAALEPGQRLGIIGRRGAILAEEWGLPVAWSFPMATHVGGVLTVTRRVADHLAETGTAEILFAQYVAGGTFKVTQQSILPVEPALLAAQGKGRKPLHQFSPDILLQRLGGEYLFARISRAVMESMAGENGVRLRVMDSASDSTDRKVEDLVHQDQHLRQEEITTELLDVVAGARAVMVED